jgi:hypothetical protein
MESDVTDRRRGLKIPNWLVRELDVVVVEMAIEAQDLFVSGDIVRN